MQKTVNTIKAALATLLLTAVAGCLVPGSYPTQPAPAPRSTGTPAAKIDNAQVARLSRLTIPLLRVMKHPISPSQVQIEVLDDPDINAGSFGSGKFLVTTGLLRSANDVHLQSILAHEIAHDDLGHVYKTQTMGAGLDIATVLLDQFFPGSGQLVPLAGGLAIRAYGRTEEYEADKHGVELLRKLYPDGKERMVSTMVWLQRTAGNSGGGFFATHPSTADRIDRIRNLP